MFADDRNTKDEFIQKLKVARDERALDKKRDDAAIRIQSWIRGWLARIEYQKLVLEEFDSVFAKVEETNFDLVPVLDVYSVIKKFLYVWNKDRDKERFETLCRYIVKSLDSRSPSISFIGVFLQKEHSVLWITRVKDILYKCNVYLKELDPDVSSDTKFMLILLHTMISFTATNSWFVLRFNEDLRPLIPGMNQFCNNIMAYLIKLGFYPTLREVLMKRIYKSTMTLSAASMTAIMTLALRPLRFSGYSDHMMSVFIAYIFSIPAFMFHVGILSPQIVVGGIEKNSECVGMLEHEKLMKRLINLLKKNPDIVVDDISIEGNHLLCLIANFIHLGSFFLENLAKHELLPDFMEVLIGLLNKCKQAILNQKSNTSNWHPILGWHSPILGDINVQEHINDIKYQLSLLWSTNFVNALLCQPLQDGYEFSVKAAETPRSSNAMRRMWDYLTTKKNAVIPKETPNIVTACCLYYNVYTTFTQMYMDVLTGLCYQSNVLLKLYSFLLQCYNNFKVFYRLVGNSSVTFAACPGDHNILLLFAECMTHYITILDDLEMYEEQKLFTLENFAQIGSFMNMFLYKGIINEVFVEDENEWSILFASSHSLLSMLYLRDCRRIYAPPNHWLIKDIKASSFFHDLDKNKTKTKLLKSKLPHALSCKDRVHLFRKNISMEKLRSAQSDRNCTDCVSTSVRMIRIRREHIVEDAFCYMRNWSAADIKKCFRVKFVNTQGLEEAGIDQQGVLKEFLEEFMKRIFDPGLNLFKTTSDEYLYPSSLSYINENHLQLFEFAGKMLAKAIYEGVVVDVPLAAFFLSQVLGHNQSVRYSYIDDLPSLDAEFYRSLMCIKHFDGDANELTLNFSVPEDIFGEVVQHELVPGGKYVAVTNYNKIIYIHLMAHFRMHTQIKEQINCFSRGFHSIFSKDQLSMFSTPEFQMLIAGKNEPVNLVELRQYTQYYGGFHDGHKVVVWLWDVLANDFTEEERRLFLKFVTSCSKPPVLGFAYLHPPFSIRCVEVSEEEDNGDSVGSVVRGFFTIRRKGPEYRLPTSSTCFNLLKLPNYSRRSILRDKLRYAINSNTGFELS